MAARFRFAGVIREDLPFANQRSLDLATRVSYGTLRYVHVDAAPSPENAPMTLFRLALALIALLVPALSWAQEDVDALWTQFDELFVQYEDQMVIVDAEDPSTTGGDRAYRQAADTAGDLSAVVEAILAADSSLSEDEREGLIDVLLTTRQIEGSLLVDTGQCDEAVIVLDRVLSHPFINSRGIVQERAAFWMESAETCLEERDANAQNNVVVGPGDEPSGNGRRTVSYALLGTGGAMLVAGIAWDLSNLSDINELNGLRQECTGVTAVTECSPEEEELGDNLSDQLDSEKAPIAVLYSAGAAIAVTGLVLLITDRSGERNETEARSRFVPTFGPNSAGVLFERRF